MCGVSIFQASEETPATSLRVQLRDLCCCGGVAHMSGSFRKSPSSSRIRGNSPMPFTTQAGKVVLRCAEHANRTAKTENRTGQGGHANRGGRQGQGPRDILNSRFCCVWCGVVAISLCVLGPRGCGAQEQDDPGPRTQGRPEVIQRNLLAEPCRARCCRVTVHDAGDAAF